MTPLESEALRIASEISEHWDAYLLARRESDAAAARRRGTEAAMTEESLKLHRACLQADAVTARKLGAWRAQYMRVARKTEPSTDLIRSLRVAAEDALEAGQA